MNVFNKQFFLVTFQMRINTVVYYLFLKTYPMIDSNYSNVSNLRSTHFDNYSSQENENLNQFNEEINSEEYDDDYQEYSISDYNLSKLNNSQNIYSPNIISEDISISQNENNRNLVDTFQNNRNEVTENINYHNLSIEIERNSDSMNSNEYFNEMHSPSPIKEKLLKRKIQNKFSNSNNKNIVNKQKIKKNLNNEKDNMSDDNNSDSNTEHDYQISNEEHKPRLSRQNSFNSFHETKRITVSKITNYGNKLSCSIGLWQLIMYDDTVRGFFATKQGMY